MDLRNQRETDNLLADLAMYGFVLSFVVPALLYFTDVIDGAQAVLAWFVILMAVPFILSIVESVINWRVKRKPRQETGEDLMVVATGCLIVLGAIALYLMYFNEPDACDENEKQIKLELQTFNDYKCVPN